MRSTLVLLLALLLSTLPGCYNAALRVKLAETVNRAQKAEKQLKRCTAVINVAKWHFLSLQGELVILKLKMKKCGCRSI